MREQLAIEREAKLPSQRDRQPREKCRLVEPLHASVQVVVVVVHALSQFDRDALVPHVRVDCGEALAPFVRRSVHVGERGGHEAEEQHEGE